MVAAATVRPAPQARLYPLSPISTARLISKTSNTVLYDAKTYGLARLAVQGLIDQCNGFRKGAYGLPPVSPPESVLAALDV